MSIADFILTSAVNTNSSNSSSNCFSIATGIVKENWDQDHQGMVKVELLLGETGKTTTDWIRVMQPYAGNGFGEYFLPEINTEVVLGFNNGDPDSAIVLGCLWNQVDKIPQNTANKDNSVKSIITKGGHKIIFDETKDKEKVQIITKGEISVLLDDKNQKVSLQDKSKENSLLLDGKKGEVTISAKKKIVLKANNTNMLTLDGSGKKAQVNTGTVEIKGSQKLSLQGASLEAGGNQVKISSKGTGKFESSGILQIKGSMVKVN